VSAGRPFVMALGIRIEMADAKEGGFGKRAQATRGSAEMRYCKFCCRLHHEAGLGLD
jgi:hypothetical protein